VPPRQLQSRDVATFRYDATGGLPHLCAGLWRCFTGIGGSID